LRVVKNNLFDIPPVFNLIQEASKSDNREMLQVFNMGCRMEIYTTPEKANQMIEISQKFGVDAKIIGFVEFSDKKCLDIHFDGNLYSFE
jgi:phosphoribosylformylglycinamidine cyclo-ligase